MAEPAKSNRVSEVAVPARHPAGKAPVGQTDETGPSAAASAKGAGKTVGAGKIAAAETASIEALEATQAPDETGDAAATEARREARAARRRSLRKQLDDFIMPKFSDPSILQGGTAIGVMEAFLSGGLNKLEGASELRSLAIAVIRDEILRHRSLLDRRHHAIAA